MARPTKYSKEAEKAICTAIAAGVSRKWAAAAGGVSYDSLNEWVKRGEAGEEPYASFASLIKDAQDRAVAWHLANIRRHAVKNWTASAWWLERMYPEEFGRQRLEITGKDGGSVQHEVTSIRFIVIPPADSDAASEQ